jgi:hypothetical protein
MKARRSSLLALLVVAGCGSNRPEIPPELLEPASGGSGGGASYPAGPYGREVGDVIENLSFQGWPDPLAAGFDPGRLETLAFADFYDPEGQELELVLINTAAVWCQACKIEHETLPEENAEFSSRGLRIFSALLQDARSQPATIDDLVIWTSTFDVDYPMALDPEYQMAAFAPINRAPLNLVVDARTMQITRKSVGDTASTLFSYISGELSARGR